MMSKGRASSGMTTSGRPMKSSSTSVTRAAGNATRKLTRNLSRISQRWLRVAAMVVSEIMDRLSPNMAPPTTAPMTTVRDRPPFSAMPTAMGMTAETVPMEEPVAVPIKAEMTNRPAARNCTGTRDRPRFTVDSRPPILAATCAKAPARI